MTRLRADLCLLVTAMIWGTAFVAQKLANATMGPISFVGARFILSAIMVLPLAVIEARKATTKLRTHDIMMAVAIGFGLLIGSILQQTALITTTATNGGFLTALYVVLVPVATWILTRERIRGFVALACMISVTGAWLLTYTGEQHRWEPGYILLVISDFAWAFAISLIAVFLKRAGRPFFLACTQFTITGVLGLAAGLLLEPGTVDGWRAALPAILYAGLVSGGIAFTLQIVAQRHTPAPEAAIIMSLESVFAAIAGAILLAERLTPLAMLGCVLILGGVLTAEMGPALLVRPKSGRG